MPERTYKYHPLHSWKTEGLGDSRAKENLKSAKQLHKKTSAIMFTKTFSAAVVILLLYITTSEAMALARSASELRCQCIKLESRQISTKQMDSVELIPSGPHCKNVEVIITLKSGDLVCVDPSASWVQRIIRKILESQENKEEASVSQQ